MDSAYLRKLCDLCALRLNSEEETALLQDIQKIANEFEILCELPPCKALPDESRIYFREDQPFSLSTSDRTLLLDNFPSSKGDCLLMPALLEAEIPSED
jgi:Asp-tRNA(Asn)/Glu-tRNA(Gln) amidotransferase C subunit